MLKFRAIPLVGGLIAAALRTVAYARVQAAPLNRKNIKVRNTTPRRPNLLVPGTMRRMHQNQAGNEKRKLKRLVGARQYRRLMHLQGLRSVPEAKALRGH